MKKSPPTEGIKKSQDGVYAIRLYSDKKSVIILWVYLFGGGIGGRFTTAVCRQDVHKFRSF